ncbi:MAG: EF-P beta-lysylation protein EpmB [Coxiellaceae bacterium]|nr:MAG: EF-P beta-lysylation protein EpmB [Coxiellaceae bacterium]
MVPQIDAKCESSAWQKELASMITDPQELWQLLALDATLLPAAQQAAALFPLRATRSYVSRMRQGDVNDPLLQQVLPLGLELQPMAGYSQDPLQEAKARKVPGLLHKYRDRALLMLTGACAVHCRYCFRRHFPYADNTLTPATWQPALAYLAEQSQIKEVILSGGDPLVVKDVLLDELLQELAKIKHLQRVRIHTRLPIVLPSRITVELLQTLTRTRLPVVMVLHSNHAQEINSEVQQVCYAMRTANLHLLNQTVLLKNINDNVETLIELSEVLFNVGVLPYYLHMLDAVDGAAHFAVSEVLAKELIVMMKSNLPGYLVPKLVREVAGHPSKLEVI